jgi:23S rRNA pseudouridine2605 synthase
MSKQRIHKLLSEAGVASRRAAEEMIVEGRVTVNGKTVRDLPCFVSPGDEIRVDGQKVRKRAEAKVYFLVNKPRGVVCTQKDPQGRLRAVDLIPPIPQRAYCVGRLDADSTGLLVITNDGELTQQLTHPSYGVPKTYVVEIEGRISGEQVERLKRGIYLEGRKTRQSQVKVLRRAATHSMLEICLREGRNREIRRMLLKLGHKVRKLKRTAIGPITDRGLKIGSARPMKPSEVRRLSNAGERDAGAKRRGPRGAGPKKPKSRSGGPSRKHTRRRGKPRGPKHGG